MPEIIVTICRAKNIKPETMKALITMMECAAKQILEGDAARTREIQSRIPKALLEKRLQPGGCYCEELTSDGFCKHCGCRIQGIER